MTPHCLPPDLHESLAAIPGTNLRIWRSRETLFCCGERITSVYLIRAGLVGLESVQKGKPFVQIVGPGAVLGCEIVFEDAAHDFAGTALAAVEALQIPAEGFLRWCEATPIHWKAVMRYTMGESAALAHKVEQLCSFAVRDRIVHYLSELAGTSGVILPEGRVLRLSHLQLARYVGATRETASTILNVLAREGRISLGHRCIIIHRGSETLTTIAAAAGE
jgi:CRP/FNR family transcriptional regulator